MARLLHLENRGVVRLAGPDSRPLLQGLITNDVEKLNHDTAIYAGLLTPQGKFLFDMIIVADGGDLLLDIEAARKDDLIRRLMMYRLRADVDIIADPASVWALFDGEPTHGVSYPDPRHKSLHWRVISANNPAPAAESLAFVDYEQRRIRHGVPDGSRDMAVERYFWLETGAEKLNGVSFTKGCFVGQELTARMKHRMSLKKQLVAMKADGPTTENSQLQAGDSIITESGKTAGEIRTVAGSYLMAFVRLEYLGQPLSACGVAVNTISGDT